MSYNVLDKSMINNFEAILSAIAEDPNFENIDDIIYFLDRFDTRRDIYDPDLKDAIFTIVKEIIDRDMLTPLFGFAGTSLIPEYIPQNSHETLEYMEKHWGSDDDEFVLTRRGYLLFFERKNP